MVNLFYHKREINEAMMTEKDHECAICSYKDVNCSDTVYSERISCLMLKFKKKIHHCPGARSLKLNFTQGQTLCHTGSNTFTSSWNVAVCHFS